MRRLIREVRKDPSPPAHPFHRLHLSNSSGNFRSLSPHLQAGALCGRRAYTLTRYSVSISFISTSSEDFFIPVPRPTQKRNTSLREAGFYAPHQSLSTVFFLNSGNIQTRFQNLPATPRKAAAEAGFYAPNQGLSTGFLSTRLNRLAISKQRPMTPLWLDAT